MKKIKPEDIKNVRIYIGGFFGGRTDIKCGYDENGAFINESFISGRSMIISNISINELQFKNLRKFLLDNLEIEKWESSYFNSGILDGEQWEVEFTLISGEIVEWSGSNEYPDNFGKLRRKLNYYKRKGMVL
jgi:hypothetical protein